MFLPWICGLMKTRVIEAASRLIVWTTIFIPSAPSVYCELLVSLPFLEKKGLPRPFLQAFRGYHMTSLNDTHNSFLSLVYFGTRGREKIEENALGRGWRGLPQEVIEKQKQWPTYYFRMWLISRILMLLLKCYFRYFVDGLPCSQALLAVSFVVMDLNWGETLVTRMLLHRVLIMISIIFFWF